MKIAIITCYDQPDYVRARSLRTALATAQSVELVIVSNRHRGLLRYLEVPLRILWVRFTVRPRAYFITFRGYEMLLFMVMTLVRKPIVFDELVNFTEWMVEHRRLKKGALPYRLFRASYAWLCRRARIILADTAPHAAYSAKLNKLDMRRYEVIPVGVDEVVFQPRHAQKAEPFTVFFYGHMLPLHGLPYVLDAARLLKDQSGIRFHIVGGKPEVAKACREAAAEGANIDYQKWLPFEEIPKAAASAGLCLGGPFGDTLQAKYVITGKTHQFLALEAPVLVGRNLVNKDFEDKRNSLVVPQADAGALAESIKWAKAHPKELESIGKQGRLLYQAKYSQEVINGLVRTIVDNLAKPV